MLGTISVGPGIASRRAVSLAAAARLSPRESFLEARLGALTVWKKGGRQQLAVDSRRANPLSARGAGVMVTVEGACYSDYTLASRLLWWDGPMLGGRASNVMSISLGRTGQFVDSAPIPKMSRSSTLSTLTKFCGALAEFSKVGRKLWKRGLLTHNVEAAVGMESLGGKLWRLRLQRKSF